jgi:hypothetical protein
MTHPADIVQAALELAEAGVRPGEIARRLSIPRETIVGWVSGRTPRVREDARLPPASVDLPDCYAYLLGLYLGDGWISAHPRGVYKLRIVLDAKYPQIIAECATAIAALMPGNKVGTRLSATNYVEIYGYSKRWPAYFPQHGSGMKHTRRIVLEDWQKEVVARAPFLLLRGLIHSDGCRFINTGRNWTCPRYSFSNRSADIRKIFSDACDLVGVRWTTAPHTVYVSRKADVELLDRHIGPKR